MQITAGLFVASFLVLHSSFLLINPLCQLGMNISGRFFFCMSLRESANTVPYCHKLCIQVSHIGGNHRVAIWRAMARGIPSMVFIPPAPRKHSSCFIIIVRTVTSEAEPPLSFLVWRQICWKQLRFVSSCGKAEGFCSSMDTRFGEVFSGKNFFV